MEDSADPGFQILSDSEIVAKVTGEVVDSSSDTEGVDKSIETMV